MNTNLITNCFQQYSFFLYTSPIKLNLQDPSLCLNRRNGSEYDVDLLENSFTSLGFKVERHADLNINEIKNVLNEGKVSLLYYSYACFNLTNCTILKALLGHSF